jgi:hypothetical protein
MDSNNTTKGHQERLDAIGLQLVPLVGNLDPNSLRKIHSLAGELRDIVTCHYQRYHAPGALEITSEEFQQNPGRYCDMTSERTIRVVSPKGGRMSMCSNNPLDDPFVWCPVCKSMPSMDAE